MRRIAFTGFFAVVLAAAAFAQSMGSSGTSTGSGTTSMMAPSNGSMSGGTAAMTDQAGSMNGSSAMMAEDMSYDSLKMKGKLADTRMGMQLRTAMSTGMKVAYKDLMSAERLAAAHPTVLFFAADWCPYCQADLKDINANGSRLGSINVVVVDFDKSADLRKKFGITAQDTFVQIGAMGEEVAVWNGGGVQGILDKTHQPM